MAGARPGFVPTSELPDDWSGAVTVVVRKGQVMVLDEHPDEVAAERARVTSWACSTAPRCWAVDLDDVDDGRRRRRRSRTVDALLPLMGLYGRVDDVRWTLAGRAVQLVEWERTHRFCGRCGTADRARRRASGPAAARPAACSPSRGSRRR